MCLCLSLGAVQAAQEAETIAAAIAKEIQTDQPIFVDIHAGEWTAALAQNLYRLLIAKGADVRTQSQNQLDPASAFPPLDEEPGTLKLAEYNLGSAVLVQVNLNIKWQEEVNKSFFSYRSERRPVYSFETKQIKLPEQRLLKVSAYDFFRPNSPETQVSSLRLRWFEPLVAGAAIASMIFLLWNFD